MADIDALLGKIPNLGMYGCKFLKGVLRWIDEGDIDADDIKDCAKTDVLLRVLEEHPAGDFYDEDFNGMSFTDVMRSVNLDLDADDYVSEGPHEYRIVRIHSFKEAIAFKHLAPTWCIFGSETAYDAHLENGRVRFCFLIREDADRIPAKPGVNYPHDDYGCSVMAVAVDEDNRIVSCTSRWNYDGCTDEFLTENQLRELLKDKFIQVLKCFKIND